MVTLKVRCNNNMRIQKILILMIVKISRKKLKARNYGSIRIDVVVIKIQKFLFNPIYFIFIQYEFIYVK